MNREEIERRIKIYGKHLVGFGTECVPLDITSVNIIECIMILIERYNNFNAEIYLPFWCVEKINIAGCMDQIAAKIARDMANYNECEIFDTKIKYYRSNLMDDGGQKNYIYVKTDKDDYYGYFDYYSEP